MSQKPRASTDSFVETSDSPDATLLGRSHAFCDANDSTQIERWAAVIAEGEAPFPTEPGVPITSLARAVREQRRMMLVQFIARQIASSIQASAATVRKESQNVARDV